MPLSRYYTKNSCLTPLLLTASIFRSILTVHTYVQILHSLITPVSMVLYITINLGTVISMAALLSRYAKNSCLTPLLLTACIFKCILTVYTYVQIVVPSLIIPVSMVLYITIDLGTVISMAAPLSRYAKNTCLTPLLVTASIFKSILTVYTYIQLCPVL